MISAVLTLGWLSYGMYGVILWATLTASAVLQLGLGILLGIGILKSFIKNPEANKRMDQTVAKLTPYQTKFGLAAIALGAWCIVATFMFRLG